MCCRKQWCILFIKHRQVLYSFDDECSFSLLNEVQKVQVSDTTMLHRITNVSDKKNRLNINLKT